MCGYIVQMDENKITLLTMSCSIRNDVIYRLSNGLNDDGQGFKNKKLSYVHQK